ncbi:MAG: winged helix-turn-helix transcriptional regulator [Methanosarcinales archaeon]|nr:winged helix-turn-helix transcriptional regulator [Methanosarcinales archaeon]
MVDLMASYKERILKAIVDSKDGLTTVEVARKAGVSKTTVIKYLSVLKSEGLCEFVEVGPSKLWRTNNHGEAQAGREAPPRQTASRQADQALEVQALSLECGEDDQADGAVISLSLKVKPDQICNLIKQMKRCTHE